jgi:hypothetical protein
MTELHQFAAALAAVATVGLVTAALWSAIAARRSAGASDHRVAVDRLVLAVTALIAGAGAVGLGLLIGGRRPADPLHFLYAIVALATPLGGWWLGARGGFRGPARPPTRIRRAAWLVVAALVLLGLELRLVMTG